MQRTTLGLAIFAALGTALAQEAPVTAGAVVTVAGHYNNAVGTSDAASEGSISASLIANRPAMRTGELLEFVPGMIVTQHSGDGKANQYFLRGFNLDHGTDFATFVDGMPVNMRSHAHGQGYSDLNFLIPELVQRIDYKKGTYFANEGDFASAGAAHIRLADTLRHGVANLTLGSFGYQRAVLADSFLAGSGTLLYGVEINRNDGPWDTPEKVRKASATLRYSQGSANDGMSVTAMAYRNRWNGTDQIPARAVASGQVGLYGGIDSTDGGDSSRASLSYAMRKRSGEGLFEFDAYVLHSRLDLYSNFTYQLDRPGEGDQFAQSERRNVAGFNAAHSWVADMGGFEMRNKIGVQARFDRLSPVGLYESVARERTATVREDRVREASMGLYAENVTQWRPWLRSIAGLRYDSYRFKVNEAHASDRIASPKLSLIFGPWEKTEYFANYGKGFHSNDARGTTQGVTPLVSTRGGELGLRTEALPGLQSSFALWQLDIDSELVFVGDAGDTTPSRSSRRRGIEWNNHYTAADWLLFDVDVALSRARYTQADAAGQFIPGSLNRVVSFGATIKDLGKWSAGFDLRHFGPRPLVEDNRVRSKATTLAYARVGYQLAGNTRLALDVFNVFDRKASDIDYYYESRLPGEAQAVADRHFHPVEPRSVRVTLAHSF